jgi:hypothetical protein
MAFPARSNGEDAQMTESIHRVATVDASRDDAPAASAREEAARQPVRQGPSSERSSGVERGLRFTRFFTEVEVHPFDAIEWETRDAVIVNERGETVFEQRGVEVPGFWSQTATNVVVSKYFRGALGTPQRETSGAHAHPRAPDGVLQLAGVVQRRHRGAAAVLGVLHQLGARTPWTRSSTWPRPRACCSSTAPAPARTSPRSAPRRSSWPAAAPRGPVSFMRGYDAFAGVIKSGGKTRRAAKMVILNADHPDIEEFINCKAEEEKKAWALIDAGYDGGFNVPAAPTTRSQFQNANHSVRVTDEFMRAVLRGRRVDHPRVTDGAPDGHVTGARPDAPDRRGRLGLRRPRHAVRHHHQRLAHLPEHRAHQRQQPVQRVHVPRRQACNLAS